MSELVGRFLSFEEHLGRGLVKFVYYVLLFLLVVTTLFGLGSAVYMMFAKAFWPNLWQFLVFIPLRFFVALLLLRVGAEVVIAVLSIDDNLRGESASPDSLSTGLNPVAPPKAAPTMKNPAPRTARDEEPSEGDKSDEPEESSSEDETTKPE
ncbi:DUF4282 domain-containing protein [Parvularcula sp. ZS-1/3]|uniref:DUF4282 domain-containing protein n=1 Tax=Parvularcula mediterranea TaxID=2732508 RepID=A0A7Y3RLI0_9PROT|nr:DUF4282 domain-containing protein [Parvularcula mediterranea]NNU15746.1 DUF4282 domain-containing protein [Parvularcula mediterranea]